MVSRRLVNTGLAAILGAGALWVATHFSKNEQDYIDEVPVSTEMREQPTSYPISTQPVIVKPAETGTSLPSAEKLATETRPTFPSMPDALASFLYDDLANRKSCLDDRMFEDPEGLVSWIIYNGGVFSSLPVQRTSDNSNVKELTYFFNGGRIKERSISTGLREGLVPQHQVHIFYDSGTKDKEHEFLFDAKGGKDGHSAFSVFSKTYNSGVEEQRLFNARWLSDDKNYLEARYEIGIPPRSDGNTGDYWLFTNANKTHGLVNTQYLSLFRGVSNSFSQRFDELTKK